MLSFLANGISRSKFSQRVRFESDGPTFYSHPHSNWVAMNIRMASMSATVAKLPVILSKRLANRYASES